MLFSTAIPLYSLQQRVLMPELRSLRQIARWSSSNGVIPKIVPLKSWGFSIRYEATILMVPCFHNTFFLFSFLPNTTRTQLNNKITLYIYIKKKKKKQNTGRTNVQNETAALRKLYPNSLNISSYETLALRPLDEGARVEADLSRLRCKHQEEGSRQWI